MTRIPTPDEIYYPLRDDEWAIVHDCRARIAAELDLIRAGGLEIGHGGVRVLEMPIAPPARVRWTVLHDLAEAGWLPQDNFPELGDSPGWQITLHLPDRRLGL